MNAALIAELKQLTPEGKLRLLEELWDSLAQNPEQLPFPPEHERALAEDQVVYRADPGAGAAWAEVRQRIMK